MLSALKSRSRIKSPTPCYCCCFCCCRGCRPYQRWPSHTFVVFLVVLSQLILFGEHSVVHGKHAVAASLGLRTVCRIGVTDSDLFEAEILGEKCSWTVNEIVSAAADVEPFSVSADPVPVLSDLVERARALAARVTAGQHHNTAALVLLFLTAAIARAAGRPLRAARVVITSDLPLGAGLGSSAAYCVAVAGALLRSFGAVPDVLDDASRACINAWAFRGEQLVHGTPSGVDNTVSVRGGALVFQRGSAPVSFAMPPVPLLLVHTRVPRSTSVLVARVRELRDALPAVAQPLLDSLDAVALEAARVLQQTTDGGDVVTPLERLCDVAAGVLDALGVGHPSLTAVYSVATRLGLHAKLTGAGGGGCAFVLLRPGTDIVALQRELGKLGCDTFDVMTGAEGVTVKAGDVQ